MKKIAIIIPVFNHLDYTKRCVSSLEDCLSRSTLKHSAWDLVVIDDGSTDGTSEYLEKQHPAVHVLHGDGNLWWSGGANVGARHALEELQSDYILLWNNDVFPAEDYFSAGELLRLHPGHP